MPVTSLDQFQPQAPACPARGADQAHAARAGSHISRGPRDTSGERSDPSRASWRAAWGPLLLVTLLGCARDPASPEALAEARIEELREALEPLPLTETSDKHDDWFRAQRELLARLERAADPALGEAAWRAFEEADPERQDLRVAFLDVAAFNAPEALREELERLTTTYDGRTSLGVRTEAARLLAETSPEAAIAVLEPILREPRPHQTYPPKEELMRFCLRASEKSAVPIDELLIDVATGIAQPQEVRYVAIDGLARVRTLRAQKALETVLVETSSDGLLRRKAAQAVRDGLPHDTACAILQRVAERESDEAFLHFLADMLDKLCP